MGCSSSKGSTIEPKTKEKAEVVFVLGGPGCGKGTQCANIVRDYGLVHLSAGDLLREEKASGSKDAELINKYISDGKIVPVEITVNLIKKAMEKNGWSKKKYLIDGFPRNEDNNNGWISVMGHITRIKFILFFDCTKENMIARMEARAAAAGDQARQDDNIETMTKRFDTFESETMPVVKLYEEFLRVRKVDANVSQEEVFE